MQRFITRDGVYENDPGRQRIRIMTRGWAGPWRSYAALSQVKVGSPVTIMWEPEDAARPDQRPSSRTRPVVAIV